MLLLCVIQGKGVHAAQLREEVRTLDRIGVENGLGVRLGTGEAAFLAKKGVQLHVIVDLAVCDQGELSALRHHRLMPGRQPDNRQADLGQPDGTVRVNAAVVRAAMGECVDHVLQLAGVQSGAVAHDIPGYAAHGMKPVSQKIEGIVAK